MAISVSALAQRNVDGGAEYPYDAPNQAMLGDGDWSVLAARAVIYDLTDRRGIKHGFDNVDDDVRIDIVRALAATIKAAHRLRK